MSKETWGWIVLSGYVAWTLYMATFRTEEYRKMQDESWQRGTSILKGGAKAGGVLLRVFGPRIMK
jgi:hypothetical protein